MWCFGAGLTVMQHRLRANHFIFVDQVMLLAPGWLPMAGAHLGYQLIERQNLKAAQDALDIDRKEMNKVKRLQGDLNDTLMNLMQKYPNIPKENIWALWEYACRDVGLEGIPVDAALPTGTEWIRSATNASSVFRVTQVSTDLYQLNPSFARVTEGISPVLLLENTIKELGQQRDQLKKQCRFEQVSKDKFLRALANQVSCLYINSIKES